MAGSVNKVTLLGNLGNDPEVRNFDNGGRVCNFRMATSESWKDKQSGEKRERTQWHSVAVFVDGLVTVVERYLQKGSKVYIEGQLETRSWEDKNGEKRYTTEVVLRPFNSTLVLLGGRENSASDRDTGNGYANGQENSGPALDDEIPF